MSKFSLQPSAKVFSDTIQRFWNEGAWLLPTGGDDGKRPLLTFSQNNRHPFDLVRRTLEKSGHKTYGIRLNGLIVLDIDASDTSLVDEMLQKFGRTDFIVKTGRGFHLYYSTDKKIYLNLRSDGLPIDVKQGSNSFVLGPHSLRPDGVHYQFIGHKLSLIDLPRIQCAKKPILRTVVSANNKAPSGTRHNFLLSNAREYITNVDSKEELLANLLYDRDVYCTDPSTITDTEVTALADWWWHKRLKNQIYSKDNSTFSVSREAFYQLRLLPNGHVALDLYLYLQNKHGHVSGKTFQINVKAMQKSCGFVFGQKAMHTAINQLLELGYLRICINYRIGKHGRIFQLATTNTKS
jgi:hypothetical protein